MRRMELPWGKLRSRDVRKVLCVCGGWVARGEHTQRKGISEKFWMAGPLRHSHYLFNCRVFTSVHCPLHCKYSVKLCLGLGRRSKGRGCVLSLDHAEWKEKWIQGRRAQGSRATPSRTNQETGNGKNKNGRTPAAITGRVPHFLQDNG